jgi:hypothetical protein
MLEIPDYFENRSELTALFVLFLYVPRNSYNISRHILIVVMPLMVERKNLFKNVIGRGLWCLAPLPILFQLHLYIVAVSFIDGGNRSTQRKPPIFRKSLTNFIT